MHGELGEPRVVRRAGAALDDGPRLVRPAGGEEERDVPRHVQQAHRQRQLVAADVGEAPPVPAGEDELERRLDVGAELEPAGEPLRDLAHRRERLAGPRAGVGDRVLDQRRADLGRLAGPDVRPVEREHLGRVRRVDEEERGSMRDVVVVHLDRLVPVRRAAGGVEQRDVVGVGELLGRCAGELAEADREHRRAQRVLERLAGTEVGRERKGADHLGRTNRPLDRGCAQTVDRDDGGRGVNGSSSSGPGWITP